jgi:moderate conductance mechanosensitive channel
MPFWFKIDEAALASILRIAVILLLGFLATIALRLIMRRAELRLEKIIPAGDRRKRMYTILQAGRSIGYILISVIVLLELLHELDINIVPILASAGVAGVALSLGAQTFIRDFFGGLVILTENQFTVGDIIKVGEMTGTVERITLRATYLRDLEGRRIAIPNGDIRTVSNLSVDWARAVVTLSFPLDVDMLQVLEKLRAAAAAARADERITRYLKEEPEVQGWANLTDTSVQVRLMARTQPDMQWQVAQVLRQHALGKLYEGTEGSG